MQIKKSFAVLAIAAVTTMISADAKKTKSEYMKLYEDEGDLEVIVGAFSICY